MISVFNICTFVFIVNNRLPIAVTAYDMKRNPEFCNLLESLTHLVSENGLSKSADRDLAEVLFSTIFFFAYFF